VCWLFVLFFLVVLGVGFLLMFCAWWGGEWVFSVRFVLRCLFGFLGRYGWGGCMGVGVL